MFISTEPTKNSQRFSSKTKEEWLEDGKKLYDLRCYDEALQAYEQACHLDYRV